MSTVLSRSPSARGLRALVALWLILALLIPAAAPAAAQSLDPLARAKAELWRDGPPREGVPLLPGVESAVSIPAFPAPAPAAPDAFAPLPNWTRIAFHSFRDGNAEIYTSDVRGAFLQRLTNDPATDVNPRFSPDLSRVVFVSQRDGNWELYTADLDGGNPARLTNHPASDSEPAWSPDGRQIAFASNRNGGWGIFVMNFDGTGQRQLTSGYDDGSPAWALDGSRIAFLRYGREYTALRTVDLAGQETQLHPGMRYASHPVWSPDGRRIGIDYDTNGDYWNEIATVELGSGYTRLVYGPTQPGVDLWMGSWSPDGNTIMLTVAVYQVSGNQLVLAGGVLATVPLAGGDATALPNGSGADFNPDWINVDRTPPATQVEELPGRSPAAGVTVSWRGQDGGGSGLASFDVEARVNGGAWQAWKSGVAAGSATYAGAADARVEFRSRGRDYAGNVEPWPATPDAATRFYASTAGGTITDVRGQPIPGATVSGSPGAGGQTTGPAGAYRAYFSATDLLTLTASHAAYRSTLAFLGGRTDYAAPLVLPPTESYLTAGNPEGPGEIPAPWVLGGDVKPALTSAVRKVNATSIALGAPAGLTAPELMGRANGVTMAVRDGVANVITIRPRGLGDTDGYDLLLSRKTGAGPWSEPVAINADASWPQHVSAAMDSRLGLYVVWVSDLPYESSGVLRHCYIPAGSFTCNASGIPGWGQALSPEITVDGLDGLHVAEAQYAHRTPEGVWDIVEPLTLPRFLGHPDIAVDPDGRPHLVWAYWPEYKNHTDTYYSSRSPDATWSSPVRIAGGGNQWSDPQIVAAAGGALHVVWRDLGNPPSRGVYYTSREPGGNWQASKQVSGSIDRVAFAAGPQGVQIVMKEANVLREYTLQPGEGWRVRREWPTNATHGIIGMLDGPADLHLLVFQWPDGGDYLAYYQGPTRAAADSASTLSQAVAIPADSHRPTLSFWFKAEPTVAPGAFTVTAEVDGATEPLPFKPTGEDWQHAWADMSAYAGKTVTLRFELRTPAGAPTGSVYLDDVTLGPWLTPVIESVSIEGATITIEGDNFLATPAVRIGEQTLTVRQDGDTLIATAPAPLKRGRHTVWVTNPGGQPAAAEVWVGQGLWLPRVMVGF